SSGYGQGLANVFRRDHAPTIVTRSLQHAGFAATDLRVEAPDDERSAPVKWEDAYNICVMQQDMPGKRYWEEGVELGTFDLKAGDAVICDLRSAPQVYCRAPVHTVLMYLPRATLNTMAEQENLPRVENLRIERGAGFRDDVIRSLGMALLPALGAPDEANHLFTDHVALALASHTAAAYGGQALHRPLRGG